MIPTLPFAQPGYWFKGNLHTHTTQSDGEYTPDQAIAWYRAHLDGANMHELSLRQIGVYEALART